MTIILAIFFINLLVDINSYKIIYKILNNLLIFLVIFIYDIVWLNVAICVAYLKLIFRDLLANF